MHRLFLLALILIFAACMPSPVQPTLDLGGIRNILPTLSPELVAAQAQLADADTLAQGSAIYQQYCAACHGVDGAGQFPDHPLEPDATGRYGAPPHNQTGHTWHHDDDLLVSIVRGGGVGPADLFYVMPPFGSILNDEQIAAVLAYIKTLWTAEQRTMQAERTLQVRAAD